MDYDFLFITLLLIVTGFFIVKKDILKRLFNRKSTLKEDFAEADETVLSFLEKYKGIDTPTLMQLLYNGKLSFEETKAIEHIIKNRQGS